MTTVLEKAVREAADAIIEAARQFNARLGRAERALEELGKIKEQLKATQEALGHVMGQLKLTYEALDHVLHAMKVDEDKHDKEHGHEHEAASVDHAP